MNSKKNKALSPDQQRTVENANPLSVSFAGLNFHNPLIATAGTAGYAHDLAALTPLQHFGGITLKTVTPEPWKGAAHPRVCETEAGLINAIGLQNDGIQKLIKKHLPLIEKQIPSNKAQSPKVIVSLAANTSKQFAKMVDQLQLQSRVDIIELNVSCPNSDYGGQSFASNHKLLKQVVSMCVRENKKKVLMVKLSPHVDSIGDTAKVVEDCGVDAISLTNTYRGLKINVSNSQTMIANVVGGYSGLGIKPISLAMVYEVAQAVELPVMGIGGVFSGYDAAEYLIAGATVVGVGTATMVSVNAGLRIKQQLHKIIKKKQTTVKAMIKTLCDVDGNPLFSKRRKTDVKQGARF